MAAPGSGTPTNPLLHPPFFQIQGVNPDAPISSQLEQVDQLNTLALQEIDANFARFHQIVTSRILPEIKRFALASEPTRAAASFWRAFYERAAGYEHSMRETSVVPETEYDDHTLELRRDETDPSILFDPEAGVSSTPASKRHHRGQDPHTPDDQSWEDTMGSPFDRVERQLGSLSINKSPDMSMSSPSLPRGYGAPPPRDANIFDTTGASSSVPEMPSGMQTERYTRQFGDRTNSSNASAFGSSALPPSRYGYADHSDHPADRTASTDGDGATPRAAPSWPRQEASHQSQHSHQSHQSHRSQHSHQSHQSRQSNYSSASLALIDLEGTPLNQKFPRGVRGGGAKPTSLFDRAPASRDVASRPTGSTLGLGHPSTDKDKDKGRDKGKAKASTRPPKKPGMLLLDEDDGMEEFDFHMSPPVTRNFTLPPRAAAMTASKTPVKAQPQNEVKDLLDDITQNFPSPMAVPEGLRRYSVLPASNAGGRLLFEDEIASSGGTRGVGSGRPAGGGLGGGSGRELGAIPDSPADHTHPTPPSAASTTPSVVPADDRDETFTPGRTRYPYTRRSLANTSYGSDMQTLPDGGVVIDDGDDDTFGSEDNTFSFAGDGSGRAQAAAYAGFEFVDDDYDSDADDDFPPPPAGYGGGSASGSGQVAGPGSGYEYTDTHVGSAPANDASLVFGRPDPDSAGRFALMQRDEMVTYHGGRLDDAELPPTPTGVDARYDHGQ